VLPKIKRSIEKIIVGTCCFLGNERCRVGKYSFPPREAAKTMNGSTKAIASIGIINTLFENKSVEFNRLKIAISDIIKKVRNAVPDEEKSISRKKSLIF
jgi:hypothetical protein